jgi:hypothetical protein
MKWGFRLSELAGCFICNSLCGAADIPWSDRPLALDPRHGGILPGVGALIPGYVLICPSRHVPNFCSAIGDPGMVSFMERTIDFLEEQFGQFTYFEHGGEMIPSAVTSSCVDHAHIHVFPGKIPIELPEESTKYANLLDFLERGKSSGTDSPYLMLGHSDGPCLVAKDIGVPQFFRRQIARILGDPESWDYAAAPYLDKVKQTITMVLGGPVASANNHFI